MLYDELVKTGKNKWYNDRKSDFYYFVKEFVPGEEYPLREPHFKVIKFYSGREPVLSHISLHDSKSEKVIPAGKVPREFRKQLADILKSRVVNYDLDRL